MISLSQIKIHRIQSVGIIILLCYLGKIADLNNPGKFEYGNNLPLSRSSNSLSEPKSRKKQELRVTGCIFRCKTIFGFAPSHHLRIYAYWTLVARHLFCPSLQRNWVCTELLEQKLSENFRCRGIVLLDKFKMFKMIKKVGFNGKINGNLIQDK